MYYWTSFRLKDENQRFNTNLLDHYDKIHSMVRDEWLQKIENIDVIVDVNHFLVITEIFFDIANFSSMIFECYNTPFYAFVENKTFGGGASFPVYITLEVILKDQINLLYDERYYNIIHKDTALHKAITARYTHGIDSNEFHLAKLDWLSEIISFNVEMKSSHPYSNFFNMDRWYCFYFERNESGGQTCTVINEAYNDSESESGFREMKSRCTITRLLPDNDWQYWTENQWNVWDDSDTSDSQMQLNLQNLFAIKLSFIPDKIPPVRRNYAANITHTKTYRIGQALCVGLFSGAAPYVLEGFFDFGYPDNFNRPKLGDVAPVAANCRTIDGNIAAAHTNGHPLTIILSHWHDDHINLVNRLNSINVLQNTVWYAPNDSRSTRALRIYNNLRRAGATVHLINATGNIAVGANVQAYKINLPGQTLKTKHAHHNGICVRITLGSGFDVFLAGDCTYEAIPPAFRNGALALQACHHGGNYHVTRAAAQNNSFVPTPTIPAPANPYRIIYSYGLSNKHGHPTNKFMLDHQGKGWPNAAPNEFLTPIQGDVNLF